MSGELDAKVAEEWRKVAGFAGAYHVSNLGRVRSQDRIVRHNFGGPKKFPGRVLSIAIDKKGYASVSLSTNGKAKTYKVHQLVAEAFLGARNGKHVNHKDSNPGNNAASNLEYVTHAENVRHAAAAGSYKRREAEKRARKAALLALGESIG